MNLGLDGKVALVCGASRGLGRAVAEELAAEGASVAVCSRSRDAIEAAAREIGPDALPVAADLGVTGEPTRAVEETIARFGRVDILVANTGGPPAGTTETLELEEWDRATSLLVKSAVELCGAVLPGMRERGWGRILMITSITAKQPVDNLMLSNALRPAVAGFAHSLAREVATAGITVNTIQPGYINTERVIELNRANAAREQVDPSAIQARIEDEIPMRRLGEPRELAALAAFLASERASYITGGAFPVDGAWLRGSF